MKNIFVITIAVFIANISFGQTPTFQVSINNTGGTQSNQMYDAKADASGNVYFCGKRIDVITFSGTTLNAGIGGVYFGKANSAGVISWLKGGGTTMANGDAAYDVALDQNNNIYICGGVTTLSTAIFDGVSMAFANPGFVLKADNNGNVLWVEGYGSPVYGIAVDNNNVPVINIGTNTIAKIDASNGAIVNSVSFSGDLQSPFLHNVEVDANNNIIVQGGNKILKFDSSLNQLWSTPVTFSLAETFRLNLDNSGNVYASFYALFGTVTVGTITKSNFPNGYIYKLDNATGQPLFVDSVLIAGAASKIKEVIPDNSGNYYIMGDGSFNTPHIVKMTSAYSTLWDRALDNNAGLIELDLLSENCLLTCGKHDGTFVLDATTLSLPAGSGVIDNSFMTFLCDGTVGLNDDGLQVEELNVYPNPANNEIHFNSENIAEVVLTDITGRKCSFSVKPSGILDVSDITPGMYVLTLKANDGNIRTAKFVKE